MPIEHQPTWVEAMLKATRLVDARKSPAAGKDRRTARSLRPRSVSWQTP